MPVCYHLEEHKQGQKSADTEWSIVLISSLFMLYLTFLKHIQSHLGVRNTGPLSRQWETVCSGWDELQLGRGERAAANNTMLGQKVRPLGV